MLVRYWVSSKKLVNNRYFELFVLSIIILSALQLGARTFDLGSGILQFVDTLDMVITVFFLLELVVRFGAYESKRDFFKNAWNVFDGLVVIVSLIPVGLFEMALLARLVRVFRVLRMLSLIPELRVLINALVKSLPKLGYVVLLMFIIFYIYAAVGSFLFSKINPDLWGNIAISMLTLFRVMTFEDWTDVQYETMEVYSWSWIYYLTFIFLTTFAFLNMVIGVIVNVMEQEQRLEDDEDIKVLISEVRELKEALKQQTTPHHPSTSSES